MQSEVELAGVLNVYVSEIREGKVTLSCTLELEANGEELLVFEEKQLGVDDSLQVSPVTLTFTTETSVVQSNATPETQTADDPSKGRDLPQQRPTNTLNPSTPQPSPETGGQHGRSLDPTPGPPHHAGSLRKRTRGR